MEKNLTLVYIIDMQNDFIDGSLANPAAAALIPNMVTFIKESEARNEKIIFTRDTHGPQYLSTQEGKKLPIPHCILGTDGHNIVSELLDAAKEKNIVDKPNFGMTDELIRATVSSKVNSFDDIKEIILVGTVSSICVLNNALAMKHVFPETKVVVYEDLCADITVDGQNAAMTCLRASQVEVKKYFKK